MFIYGTTDETGHFVIEGIPPGEHKVSYRPGFRDGKVGAIPLSHGEPVLVRPGETSTVVIGGSGRPVVGRVVAPVGRNVDWLNDVHTLSRKIELPPELALVPRESFPSAEAYGKATAENAVARRAFWSTEQSRGLQLEMRQYVLIFSVDGSFRIDNVPPGTYEYSIEVTEPLAGAQTLLASKRIGEAHGEFTVPEGGATDAFNVGELRLICP